ncbi:hypothetical protein BBO99_00000384 [Phytophthora kernoviae]|uniref:Uncharacterized protein n=2 Tax=Phytophthora kernoviae TaxID=325452 RepID=A0A3R7J3J5_9STRA|nr:hypothetical protein G195_001234 [Phytophthora kernoviae 00238/432]KAG2532195.1 hypothetical protein JM16_000434 [Phytophthora kernoviae]KAG2533236.1 hypothetical protein JM18_000535 [Phytophthora kernoviae]RLN14560.1 hypothetical protein BBI17_000433 [Phytophthora kernoviae]RLN85660.1 hypothetical protein BBO99_00000384 [Phytophthora kernoviae]
MDFLRSTAGTAISISLAAAVAFYTDLQLYAVVCLGVQWLSAIYAVPKQDERFFDVTGSITYAVVSLLAYTLNSPVAWRGTLLTTLVWLWCGRLGSFLYWRINECGEDKRFKEIRVDALRFLSVWSIQGLWVLLTVVPVLLMLKHGVHDPRLRSLDIVGVCLWIVGYMMEITADNQKTQFRRDKSKKGQFIQSGLWYYSRHPNYCGEIMMWIGVFCVVVHTMPSIPLLERQGNERWGETKAYQEYKAQTSLLVPLPKRKTKTA